MTRGYFGVGIQGARNSVNVGTLWRSAAILGADFMFSVGSRYKNQPSDTIKAWRHVPLYHYESLDDLVAHLPYDCPLVGVEMVLDAVLLADFRHPDRACYLLGAEDHGLTLDALQRCHRLVRLPGEHSLNVAVAGSIVLYDRVARHQMSTLDPRADAY